MHAVAFFIVALWVPGLLLGRLAGMHGWTLAAVAPLLTYALAGFAAPAFAAAEIAWTPVSAGLLVVAVAAPLVVIRLAVSRTARPREQDGPPDGTGNWTGRAHLLVAAALAVVAVFGGAVIWVGLGRLWAIPQDWDAAFHANGIRWIADTGDSSLTGMGHVNWFENDVLVYYPNAYHLVSAVVLHLAQVDVPTILNAHTVVLPGMGALAIVALVRRFGGGPVLAVAAAACSVAVTSFYDLLWRGPLYPFTTGAVLMPLATVLLVDLLDDRGVLSRIRSGLLFAVALVGLISLNPAVLFSAAVFTLPAIVQRWAGRPRLLRTEPLLVLAAGVGSAVLALPQLLGSLSSTSGEPAFDWPATLTLVQAVKQLVTLSHAGAHPEWVLAVAGLVGLIGARRLGGLRWLIATGAIFGTLFVLAGFSDAAWVNEITRPWWNDRWRFIGLCVVPIAVLAGHGIVETHRWIMIAWPAVGRRFAGRLPEPRATAAAVVIGVLAVALSGGLYTGQNISRMRLSAPDGPVVSSLEIDAMRALATMVPPGQRVLNDRGDGSAWMFAIAGVLPVAGHYNASRIGPDADLLAGRFNDYATDAKVRAAVSRLGIEYVMVGRGYIRGDYGRQYGLARLDRMRWLETVYENRDAVVYRIRPITPRRQ